MSDDMIKRLWSALEMGWQSTAEVMAACGITAVNDERDAFVKAVHELHRRKVMDASLSKVGGVQVPILRLKEAYHFGRKPKEPPDEPPPGGEGSR